MAFYSYWQPLEVVFFLFFFIVGSFPNVSPNISYEGMRWHAKVFIDTKLSYLEGGHKGE